MKNDKMDEGDTEHSACPVLKGEKWITTVWMREGVSRKPHENWTHFDPDGTRMNDASIVEDNEEDHNRREQQDEL